MLSNRKIIIATHIYATGPALDLRDYFNNKKIGQLLFIAHPLFYSPHLKGSGYQIYRGGQLFTQTFRKIQKIPEILTYFIHPVLTIWYVLRMGTKWDVYIGNDNLNAVCGIFLKCFGFVGKTVYYVIDYNPHRFPNKILNSIYHFLDRVCVKYSDETWNLSPRMKTARQEYFGLTGGNQKTVPLGVWLKRIREFSKNVEFDPNILVYMGQIAQKQGIQHVIDAVPLIVEQLPDFRFLVIGGGDYLEIIKKQVSDLHMEKYVVFTGFVEKHEDIERQLAKCAVAVALYEKLVDGFPSFTYYTDPGKVKSYLASGLPVLISDVPYNAEEIEHRQCGLIVDSNPNSIAKAVIQIISNPMELVKYRENARKYAEGFDWETIFPSALRSLVPEISKS